MKPTPRPVAGGATAPVGFLAAGVRCGIKPGQSDRPDLALVYSDRPATAAATFTTNRVKAAPVLVSRDHLRGGTAQAIVANSGNANACTGLAGLAAARRMAAATAAALAQAGRATLDPQRVLVCSTGRIGVPLPVAKVGRGIAAAAAQLATDGSARAARAIMTSDTFPKEAAVEFGWRGRIYRVGGIAKGAGMIAPDMATMLAFLTTDAAVSGRELRALLRQVVGASFNRITIDGDMSTNDTVLALANGAAGGPPFRRGQPGFDLLAAAFTAVADRLARMIVADGEGTSRFIELQVRGAATARDARLAANAVANSILVKCAWYGGDPNWGRILDAVGYSGAAVAPGRVSIRYDRVRAVAAGVAVPGTRAALRRVAARKQFVVGIDLALGKAAHTVYTTDLTPAYVEFNKGE